MVLPTALFGANPLGGILIALVVPTLMVIFGTYVGVLGALQTFFGEDSWQDVVDAETRDSGSS